LPAVGGKNESYVVRLRTRASMMNGNNHHTNAGDNLDGEWLHVLR